MPVYENVEWEEKPQLQMRWPKRRSTERLPADKVEGIYMRSYLPGDEPCFLSMMQSGDFDPWDETKLHENVNRVIPGGWFFAVDESSQRAVGTVMCLHNYSGRIPFRGDIGWLCCNPAYRGRGVGKSLTVAATNRFLDAGYADIHLSTEYYRLPAIRTYLNTGYMPILESTESAKMWQDACRAVGWPYMPDRWVSN